MEKGILRTGDLVTYTPPFGMKEKGIVKSIPKDSGAAFVAYNWGDDREGYQDYTGQRTDVKFLTKGW